MALGDVLDTIGNVAKGGARIAGAVAPVVAQVIGDVSDPEQAAQRRQNQFDLETQARHARASQIESALGQVQEGPERQALLQQYFDLFPSHKDAPALMERLRRITHPQGAVAQAPGPMSESLGMPNAGSLAQMLGNVSPPPVGKIAQGSYDIPGEEVLGEHDVYGNPAEKGKIYRRNINTTTGKGELIPTQPRTTGPIRALPPISMSAAKTLAAQGIPFLDESGAPIDVTQFDNTMQLVPVKAGNHTSFQVTSQKQTHFNFGGQVVAVPQYEQMSANTEGVVQGPAQIPTVSTHQVPGINPITNEPGLQTLTTTRTPVIGGRTAAAPVHPATTPNDIKAAEQAAEADATPSPMAQALSGPPAGKAKTPKAKAPAATPTATPSAPPTGAANPVLVPYGPYNTQLGRAAPVRVVANQIFGDPNRPDFKPLTSYGDVLDDPAAVKRIANVSRLMIEELATENPTKSGGFWTLLTTNAGLPQALAAAQAKQSIQAINKLTPREREFVDAAMDTFGAMSGFRAITKGAASQFAMKNLEREVPLPGFSLSSDKGTKFQFYDKLSRMAEEVNSGTKGNFVLSPEEKNFYNSQFGKLNEYKEASRVPWSKKQFLEKNPNADIDKAVKAAEVAGRKVVP